MFSVKLVARPDARMVEVPLEIDAELPREFEGAALLAASGLPRKVRIKAAKDSLKLSTAYRTDQLVGDIVKSSMRGTQNDVQRVQDAVNRFIRTVRERRQEGATLVVNSNGRGKIDVIEQMPASKRATISTITPAEMPRVPPDLEKRLSDLEVAVAKLSNIEDRLASMQSQIARALAAADVAGPGMEKPPAQVISRAAAATHRTTAVEAYAEGLRHELRATTGAALSRARGDTERADKAAALAAEAELLGAPSDGTTQRLREASAGAAARQEALARLAEEIEFYAPADLPVAQQLLSRLEDGPRPPDPAPSLEPVAQGVVRAAKGGDCKPRTAWLKRAAALCGWTLVEPARGDKVDPEWHQAVDSGGESVVRLACPGLKHADGSGIVRARVHVDPAAASLPEEPDEPAAVPEPIAPPPKEELEVTRKLELPPPKKAEADPEEKADPPPPPAAPFGEIASDEKVRPEEAAAAASAAARMPKIVPEDPSHDDEALAAEVALAIHTEMGTDKQWAKVARGPDAFESESPADVSDDEVEEVHELKEPLPEPEPAPAAPEPEKK